MTTKNSSNLADDDRPASPLRGLSAGKIALAIGTAIALPGGLYVLAALVIAPLIARRMLKRASERVGDGELKKALSSANRAVWVSRGNTSALAQRAAIQLERGELKAALEDAQRALKRNPDSVRARLVRALIYEEYGETRAALADYRRLLEEQPADDPRIKQARLRETELEALQAESSLTDEKER